MADEGNSSSENEEIHEESASEDDDDKPGAALRKRKKTGYLLNGLTDLTFQDQVELIKRYLKEKTYPPGCSQSFRRGLRRRTKSFRLRVDPETDEEQLQYGKMEHGLPKPRWLEVVGNPEVQQRILLQSHISEEDGNHSGRDVTHRRVTERFYWQTVGQDCINFVRSCKACQNNTNQRVKESVSVGYIPPKSGRIQFGSGVWKQAGVAILGPHRRTHRDNKFLVVVWDYFTKWPEAQAMPYPSPLLIARFLYSIMTRMGWIRITFFDEMPEFVQEVQEEFASVSLSSQKFSAWERPRDTSLDEPFNGSLVDTLETLIGAHPDDWDAHLEWALYQYRTVKHPVMGYTPFQLIFSRLPFDPNNADHNCETYEDHVQETGEKKRAMIKDARRILGNARLRHSRRLRRSDDPAANTTPQSQESPSRQHQEQPNQLSLPNRPHQPLQQATPPNAPPQQTRRQHPQQQQQQQQQQQGPQGTSAPPPPQGSSAPPPPHHQQPPQPPQPQTHPVHLTMAYQHQDHAHMQSAQALAPTYSYMDLPALPCT